MAVGRWCITALTMAWTDVVTHDKVTFISQRILNTSGRFVKRLK